MPTQNTLPDPNNRINAAGNDNSGSYGPGFSSVTLTGREYYSSVFALVLR